MVLKLKDAFSNLTSNFILKCFDIKTKLPNGRGREGKLLGALFAHSFIRYTINTYTSLRTCK